MPSVETKVEDRRGSHASEQTDGVGLTLTNGLGTSGTSNKAHSSAASTTEIDISSPARALAVLRWSDYALVIVCGSILVGLAAHPATLLNADRIDLIACVVLVAICGFAAYTGWRHVGVIDPRVWQSYVYVFPLLTAAALLLAIAVAIPWMSKSKPLDDLESMIGMYAFLYLAGIAIPGFICILLLRKMRVAPVDQGLKELLKSLAGQSGYSALSLTKIPRINVHRGLAFSILGMVLLLVVILLPFPTDSRYARGILQLTDQLRLIGFFFIVRARRYFQVNADHLLRVDKRPPILFLRSFSDDEKHIYGNERALLDFSLETRLANHFYRFGPFIAIGSPKETVPQPGAARVLLSDDEWQQRVLSLMRESNLIIMYSGTTEWVNWELRKVVESGRSTSLILMFPEIKGWRSSRRERDIRTRVERIREIFKDTPWNEELVEYSDFANLRAMLFRADGSMVMVKSKSRSRDAYHLAALIAHHQLLAPESNSQVAVTQVDSPRLNWTPLLAWGVAGVVAVLGAAYVFDWHRGTRLTFMQGELYYSAPVAEIDARRVGEYLVKQQIFSDQKSATVQLGERNGRYQLGFTIDPALADDLVTAIAFARIGSDLAHQALDGKPIEISFYDSHWKFIKVLPRSAKLKFGLGELYYVDPITQVDATRVGEYLVKQQIFSDQNSATVELGEKQGHYRMGFMVDSVHAEKLLTAIQFSVMGNDISREVLSGKPIDVELYDQNLKLIKALPPSALLMYGKGELYYTDPISLSEAQTLGDWMRQNGFFTETKATAVHFGREQGVYQLRFVIDPSRLADTQIIGAFIEFSRTIAEQVLGGSALLVHLCDQEFHTLKSERVEPVSAKQGQP